MSVAQGIFSYLPTLGNSVSNKNIRSGTVLGKTGDAPISSSLGTVKNMKQIYTVPSDTIPNFEQCDFLSNFWAAKASEYCIQSGCLGLMGVLIVRSISGWKSKKRVKEVTLRHTHTHIHAVRGVLAEGRGAWLNYVFPGGHNYLCLDCVCVWFSAYQCT